MTLKIAGGCGEHGRNCFYIECSTPFMVDCGVMAGGGDPYPRLTERDIKRLRYVFLTHSHADHTGALPWLYERGFSGVTVASAPTLAQLAQKPRYSVALERLCGEIGGIKFAYGASGHCEGAVWYEFVIDGKRLLFSGDYTERALVYRCDPIRGRTASAAVLDCAYGSDRRSFSECCGEIIAAVTEMKRQGRAIVFPVPKYGRGIELLRLFNDALPELYCCGDEHFMQQLGAAADGRWYKSGAFCARGYEQGGRCDVLFLSDPQLRGEYAQSVVRSVLAHGGAAVMTGTPERGSFSAQLIESGEMRLMRYPVHQNAYELERLYRQNSFGRVIPFHSAELPPDEYVIEL